MKKKITLYWILAILITLIAVVFQRLTGPTHPERLSFMLDGQEYHTKVPRSITIGGECSELKFTIKNLPPDITPNVFIRKYKSKEKWMPYMLQREGDAFCVQLPSEPAAGKIEYYLLFTKGDSDMMVAQEEPVVARFKQDVPAAILVPHILLMFAAMLLSNLAGLLAFFRRERYMGYAKIAFACLFVGGFIFGCLVQKAAFGSYWTGFPLGGDLTDNKTLAALLVWVVALAVNWRNAKRPFWVGIAAVFMLLVYSVPHSAQGSEYNYESGKIETGTISNTYE